MKKLETLCRRIWGWATWPFQGDKCGHCKFPVWSFTVGLGWGTCKRTERHTGGLTPNGWCNYFKRMKYKNFRHGGEQSEPQPEPTSKGKIVKMEKILTIIGKFHDVWWGITMGGVAYGIGNFDLDWVPAELFFPLVVGVIWWGVEKISAKKERHRKELMESLETIQALLIPMGLIVEMKMGSLPKTRFAEEKRRKLSFYKNPEDYTLIKQADFNPEAQYHWFLRETGMQFTYIPICESKDAYPFRSKERHDSREKFPADAIGNICADCTGKYEKEILGWAGAETAPEKSTGRDCKYFPEEESAENTRCRAPGATRGGFPFFPKRIENCSDGCGQFAGKEYPND